MKTKNEKCETLRIYLKDKNKKNDKNDKIIKH